MSAKGNPRLRFAPSTRNHHVESLLPTKAIHTGFAAMKNHTGLDEMLAHADEVCSRDLSLECQCRSGLPVLSKKWIGPKKWIGFCKKCKPK